MTLDQIYTVDRIRKLCGVRAFDRARLIPRTDIEDLDDGDGHLRATVRGTVPYRVDLWVEGARKAAYSCTCPQGEDGKFCKHLGAVALTLHSAEKPPAGIRPEPSETALDDDPVFQFLLSLDPHELATLVHEAASTDARTAMRVQAKIALAYGQPTIDTKAWRKRITAAFGRPSKPVDYYAANRWAQGVREVLDELWQVLDEDGAAIEAAAIISLAEYAYERATKATSYVDSSDGGLQMIAYTIATLHLRACELARPDAVELAARLAELELHDELEVFRRSAETYRDVLGEAGIGELRRLIEPAFDALGPRSENAWSNERFHLTEAMIGIGLASDDADLVIRVASADLRGTRRYGDIVEALRRAGRFEEATEWAQRGIESVKDRPWMDRDLRRALIEVRRDAGDLEGARVVQREGFERSPSLSGYKELVASAADEERDATRVEILAWLRSQSSTDDLGIGSVLVEILLYEGDLDGAWEAATTSGCRQEWWMAVARAREREHPADAIGVYQQEISDLIDKKESKHYRKAVEWMARVKPLYDACDDPDGWASYLTSVIARHRAKSSLMAMLRDNDWL